MTSPSSTVLPLKFSQILNTNYKSQITLPHLLLGLLILLYFSYSSVYANQRHLAFETNAYDAGSITQPMWNFLQGKGFAVSIMEDNGPLRWATHVEPFLFLLLPFYALWPDPRTLFFLQIAALSLAAVPIFALARRRLQNQWIALTIVLAYFLMPATQSVTLFDFHAVTFAPLFLLSAIYFLDKALAAQGKSFWLWPEVGQEAEEQGSKGVRQSRLGQQRGMKNCSFSLHYGSTDSIFRGTNATRNTQYANYIWSALFFLLALSTKEDISLHVFMIGVYLLILRRRWQEGTVLTTIGLVWFYVAFQVIIPAYRTAGGQSIYSAWFETLGNTPLEIALSPIAAPGQVLALLFRPDSIPALLMITLPMALLPWIGLPLFGLAAPSLAFTLLSQNPTLRQLETWHYAAPMLAFIMLGTIDGIARINYQFPRFLSRFTKYKNSKTEKTHNSQFTIHNSQFTLGLLAAVLLLTSLTYHHYRGYTPFSKLFAWPRITPHHQLGREIATTIPPDASVLAQSQLIPYISHREKLTIWSGPLNTDFDYIWFDLSHRLLPNRFNAHGELLTGLVIEQDFGITANVDGYLLLEKGAKREVISEELFTFTEFDQIPANAQPIRATFGNALELIAVETEIRRLATPDTEPQVILYFNILQQPTEDYQLFLYLLDTDGKIIGATDYSQPALFWWPTSRWEKGDQRQVRVNTIPWWTGDKDKFSYAIGLSHNEDPWDVSARLSITTTHQTIDDNTLLPIAAFRRFGGLIYPQQLALINEQ